MASDGAVMLQAKLDPKEAAGDGASFGIKACAIAAYAKQKIFSLHEPSGMAFLFLL